MRNAALHSGIYELIAVSKTDAEKPELISTHHVWRRRRWVLGIRCPAPCG